MESGSSPGASASEITFHICHRRETRPTIADLSMSGLVLYAHADSDGWNSPLIIVFGDSVKDFCLYQALSRMRPRVLWLPASAVGRMAADELAADATVPRLLLGLSSCIASSSLSTAGLQVTSASLDRSILERAFSDSRYAQYLSGQHESAIAAADSVPQHPLRCFEAKNAPIPSLIQVADDNVVSYYQPATLKSMRNPSPHNIRWVSELSFMNTSLPRHHMAAVWMLGSRERRTSDVRISDFGLAFHAVSPILIASPDMESALVRPTIRIPGGKDAFDIAADSAGLDAEVSDKGVYSAALTSKLGGLQEASAFLRSTTGQKFAAAYLDTSVSSETTGVCLKNKRRYINLLAMSEALGGETKAQDLLDSLSEKRILYRGLILHCHLCKKADWFSFKELSDEFECKRCRRKQLFTRRHWKKPAEPTLYYQLDEIFYQALANDGEVALLALDYVRRRDPTRFSFAQELRFVSRADDDFFCSGIETDLNLVSSGHLVIGEVKKTAMLAARKSDEVRLIERYRILAERLCARRVVFATATEAWRPETKQRLEAGFRESRVVLELIGRAELRLNEAVL